MPYPWIGPRAAIFKMSKSSVPWGRSDFSTPITSTYIGHCVWKCNRSRRLFRRGLRRAVDIERIMDVSECDTIEVSQMAKASVRDLRYEFKKIERLLNQGEEIQITKRR